MGIQAATLSADYKELNYIVGPDYKAPEGRFDMPTDHMRVAGKVEDAVFSGLNGLAKPFGEYATYNAEQNNSRITKLDGQEIDPKTGPDARQREIVEAHKEACRSSTAHALIELDAEVYGAMRTWVLESKDAFTLVGFVDKNEGAGVVVRTGEFEGSGVAKAEIAGEAVRASHVFSADTDNPAIMVPLKIDGEIVNTFATHLPGAYSTAATKSMEDLAAFVKRYAAEKMVIVADFNCNPEDSAVALSKATGKKWTALTPDYYTNLANPPWPKIEGHEKPPLETFSHILTTGVEAAALSAKDLGIEEVLRANHMMRDQY